jgi:hypothetical protein
MLAQTELLTWFRSFRVSLAAACPAPHGRIRSPFGSAPSCRAASGLDDEEEEKEKEDDDEDDDDDLDDGELIEDKPVTEEEEWDEDDFDDDFDDDFEEESEEDDEFALDDDGAKEEIEDGE